MAFLGPDDAPGANDPINTPGGDDSIDAPGNVANKDIMVVDWQDYRGEPNVLVRDKNNKHYNLNPNGKYTPEQMKTLMLNLFDENGVCLLDKQINNDSIDAPAGNVGHSKLVSKDEDMKVADINEAKKERDSFYNRMLIDASRARYLTMFWHKFRAVQQQNTTDMRYNKNYNFESSMKYYNKMEYIHRETAIHMKTIDKLQNAGIAKLLQHIKENTSVEGLNDKQSQLKYENEVFNVISKKKCVKDYVSKMNKAQISSPDELLESIQSYVSGINDMDENNNKLDENNSENKPKLNKNKAKLNKNQKKSNQEVLNQLIDGKKNKNKKNKNKNKKNKNKKNNK